MGQFRNVEHNFSSFNSFLSEDGYLSDNTLFIKNFIEVLSKIEKYNSRYIKSWIRTNIDSHSIILRRIATYLLNFIDNLSSEDKICFLNENIGIFAIDEKEEVFSVLKNEFPNLNEKSKNKLIDYIMNYNFMSDNNIEKDLFDKHVHYQKFNVLSWLKRFDTSNESLLDSINKIKDKYTYFEERDYPNRNSGPIITAFANQNIQITPDYFLKNNIETYYTKILNYDGDGFDKPDRYAILNVLSEAIEKELNLGLELSNKLLKTKKYSIDVWKYIFKGFKNQELVADDFLNIYNILLPQIIEHHNLEVASFLDEYTTNITTITYNKIENELLALIDISLQYAKADQGTEEIHYINQALNSSSGKLAQTLANLIILQNEDKDNENYIFDRRLQDLIEKLIFEKESLEALAVFSYHLNTFKVIDKSWTNKTLIPFYTSSNESAFDASWQGFISNKNYFPGIFTTLEESFLFAIQNLENISNTNFRKKFVIVYTLACVEFFRDPLEKFIPNIFLYAPELVENFYKHLLYMLKEKDRDKKTELWKNWLKEFLQIRLNNKPIQYNVDESYWIVAILLEYSYLNNEVINFISKMNKVVKNSHKIFYEIKNLEISSQNNAVIQAILTFCLESIYREKDSMIENYTKNTVTEILGNIKSSGYEIYERTNELCMKLNIPLNNDI